jgi:ABC-type multidrug transport system fused ATPase/permease subunit
MNVLRAWRVTAALAFRAWPAGAIGRVVIALVSGLCHLVLPGIALRSVLDGGGAVPMVVLAVAALSAPVVSLLWEYFQRGIIQRTNQAATSAVMAAALAPAGIEHLESARYADAMEVVRANSRMPGMLFDWLAGALAGLLSIGATLAVLVGVHPLLALPVVASVGLGLFSAATRRRALVYMDLSLPGQRLIRKLVDLATTPGPAKEVRTLGLGPWLVGRHRAETDEVVRRLIAGERGPVATAAVSGVLNALLLSLGVAWIVRLAATGRASAGDVALGIVMLQGAVSQAGFLGTTLGADLARNTHVARRYLWLLDYQPALTAPDDPQPVPATLANGIRLDGVTFRYHGCDRPALEDVSLVLPAGSTVALVGDNGAGKSTLVKLLSRFYDPEEGSITVDGVNLRDLDLDGWRAAMTGSYQDFVRFRFLAREAVGAGRLAEVDDRAKVEAASAAGGAAPFLERLRDGYETQLGRDFEGGADLSEGQWQKVALARALMRREPLLVVLDEPTAALDARAEQLLFERYAAEAAAARDRGGITVLVSHRFSTVRMADLIVVLEAGRVVESGSHDELVGAGGRYAELYRLQADRYQPSP